MGRAAGVSRLRLVALIHGCTRHRRMHTHLIVQHSPGQAVDRAAARLAERGASLDESSRSANRFRSAFLCFVPHDHYGLGWDRSLGRIGPGLKPIEVVGANDVQDRAKKTCEYQFRYTIKTDTLSSKTRLTVRTEWWVLKAQRCKHHGDPTMAEMKCEYRYRGTPPQADIEGHIYGLLRGL